MDKIRLGDIATLINGDRGKNYPSQADITDEGDIPFVNAGHLNGRSIDFEEMNYISQDKFNRLSSGKFVKGDVLYCLRGSLGKKAIVNDDVEGAIASSLVIIRPDYNRIDGDYLLFSLDSPSIKEQLIKANNGSSQPNLSAASVREYQIELPDMKVQKDVVNKLAKVRTIIDSRQHEIDLLDELIKARFVEMFGNPVENPKGYRVDTLQDLIDAGDITYHLDGNHGGDYPRSEEFVSEGVPYIGANCISNGEIDFSLAKYLTVERAGKLRKGIAQNEDVLFAHNATVGPTVVLHTTEPKVILSTSLTAYRCNKESIMPEYLATYMKSDGFVMQYSSEMKQTTRNQVPVTAQKKYLFLIPPMEEQKAFSEFVKQVDKSKVVAEKHWNIHNICLVA
ncbi:type I restriction enzyme, S subunit [Lachnospiraceae bacterium XPB1003]|nr:type I restriction enzyme, S subunit [Lachnospiraceae bacterium XPB1003]